MKGYDLKLLKPYILYVDDVTVRITINATAQYYRTNAIAL